jgi:hypothetical protein
MLVDRSDTEISLRICRSPVFVIGAHRSGTTALAWALAQHTRFWTSNESLILYPLFKDAQAQFARWYDRPSPSLLRREEISEEEFLSSLGLGLNALFFDRSGGKRWVDQTPHYGLIAGTLVKIFPGAKFLHILRDGRRVVHSMMNSSRTMTESERTQMEEGDFVPSWAKSFRAACRSWSESVEAVLEFQGRNREACLTVRNEELVSDPDAGFQAILGFLGEPHEPGPAAFFASNRINSSFGNSRDPAVVRTLTEPWALWTPEQTHVFDEVAGSTFAKCLAGGRSAPTLSG